MKKFKATINIRLKPAIKDIKALTVEQAVKNLIHINNFKCRTGSKYSVEFEAEDKHQAESIINTIADEILSNSVIEEYEIEW